MRRMAFISGFAAMGAIAKLFPAVPDAWVAGFFFGTALICGFLAVKLGR